MENHPEYIRLIKSTIEKLFVFIDQTLSHSENLNTPICSNEVDFECVIQDAFSSLMHVPAASKIQLDLHVPEGKFCSDAERLKVIFNVLLSNALRFYDGSKEKNSIKIDVAKTGPFIKMRITDNGVGIPEDIEPKNFDMFYRGNAISAGSGLGLYILKKKRRQNGRYLHSKQQVRRVLHFRNHDS